MTKKENSLFHKVVMQPSIDFATVAYVVIIEYDTESTTPSVGKESCTCYNK